MTTTFATRQQSETILEQLGGAGRIAAMTGAQIVIGTEAAAVTLYFPRQVGRSKCKLTHLVVAYNAAQDLYFLTAYRLNRRTCAWAEVARIENVFVGELIRTCEQLTNLYFSL